jgi:hypothetical protein
MEKVDDDDVRNYCNEVDVGFCLDFWFVNYSSDVISNRNLISTQIIEDLTRLIVV